MFPNKIVANKSRLASLFSVLALTVTLAACGGEGTDTVEGDTPGATDVAANT